MRPAPRFAPPREWNELPGHRDFPWTSLSKGVGHTEARKRFRLSVSGGDMVDAITKASRPGDEQPGSGRRITAAAWLAHAASRVFARWGELCCGVLLERSLLAELPAVQPPQVKASLRLAGAAHIDLITRLYASDPWLYLGDGMPTPGNYEKARELYLGRLRRGELCFLAVSGDAIAHVNWICFSWGDALPEHPIRLREGEVFTTDGLTLPAFRGKGLHAFVLRAMLAYAREQGYAQAYTLTRADRTASYKGLFQLGWKVCGRVFYFLPRGRTKALFLWRQGKVEPLFRPG
jgi:GNAT superfamily N-acetyltransferase